MTGLDVRRWVAFLGIVLVALLALPMFGCTDSASQHTTPGADTLPDSLPDTNTPPDTGDASPSEVPDTVIAMIPLRAQGEEVILGGGPLPTEAELPAMRVQLSNNFSISRTEITRAQFVGIMGYPELPDDSTAQHHPVVQVTWYDALLFCNALSKLWGLDTVYAYESRLPAAGTVRELTGLSVRWSIDGLRLPTEAEWIFAAGGTPTPNFVWGWDTSSDSASYYAWYQHNSAGVLHRVASKAPNRWGLYDMAGNALEWVFDGRSVLRDTVVTDFVGCVPGTRCSQKVVKGGSYLGSLSQLRLAARTEVYGVFPSDGTVYTGFRIARGAVTTPLQFGASGEVVGPPPDSAVHFRANRRAALSFFGTDQVLFAVVDEGSSDLHLANFSNLNLETHVFRDSSGLQHPQFSPDGNRLAWSTRMEGQRGASQIRALEWRTGQMQGPLAGAIPRWLVRSPDTLLMAVSSAMPNTDTISWLQERTLAYPLVAGQVGAGAVELAEGAYHGGISSDERWLATGFTRMRILRRDEGTVSAPFPFQVCNVSLAPDASGRVLFLDFGSSVPALGIARPYGIHEFIFLATPQGTIQSAIPPPPGYIGWDHVEFSNHPDFAVAAAWDHSEMRRAIYAIHLPDGALQLMAEGANLRHPSLWVGRPHNGAGSSFNLDSLGIYNHPFSWANVSTSWKMFPWWAGAQGWEALVLGSSRLIHGFHSERMTTHRAYNLTVAGADLSVVDGLYRDYVARHSPSLRMVIFTADIDIMDPTMRFIYALNQKQTRGYLYDRAHNFWEGGPPEGFIDAMRHQPRDSIDWGMTVQGSIHSPCEGAKDPPEFQVQWREDTPFPHMRMTMLRALLEEWRERGIRAVGVVAPMNPLYRQTPFYGRYGPYRAMAYQILDSLRTLDAGDENFLLLDYHHDGLHDWQHDEFYDDDHLCATGSARLTDSIQNAIVREWGVEN